SGGSIRPRRCGPERRPNSVAPSAAPWRGPAAQDSSMSSILVINASDPETRVALVENGHITEFYLERNRERGIVGNFSKGKRLRALPGMQAAFVVVGVDEAAFRYVSDATYDPAVSEKLCDLPEGAHPASESPPAVDAAEAEAAARETRAPKSPNGGE